MDGNPYYNLEEEYVFEIVERYIYNLEKEEDDEDIERMDLVPIFSEEDEPRDTSYGGFWYKKGKKSQEMLMGFYEHMGFYEAPEVHKEWGCYSNIPYPTMMKVL